MKTPVKIAIVGLGFGAEFIPICKKHPDAEVIAVCQRNEEVLNEIAEHLKYLNAIHHEELLKDPEIDAVI
jgi:predicted dehydrogenase